jgi:membrane protease YdiL (CAAX protease family)
VDQTDRQLDKDREPGAIHAIAVTFLCEFLIVALALAVAGQIEMGPWQVLAGAVISMGVTLAFLWFEARRNAFDPRLLLRLNCRNAGLAGFLLPVAVFGFTTVLAVTLWLDPLLRVPSWFESMLKTLLSAKTPLEYAALVLGGVVMTAIGEELLFRGWLQRSLERTIGRTKGLVLTSLLFGVFHDPWRLIPASMLGLLIGAIVMRSGSILTGIVLHVLNNLLVVTLITLEVRGRLSEDSFLFLKRPEMAILSAGLLLASILLYWRRIGDQGLNE